MADHKLFYEDPAREHVDTTVIETGELGGVPWVRLAQTVFYPEGGGQPADRGTIAGIPVSDVRSRGSQVLHFVERLPAGASVSARIDPQWRFDLRQQHTAQHLLSAILADGHALPTTSFHLGEEYTAIEVAGPTPDRETLLRFENEVNLRIREDRPVRTYWVEPEALAPLNLRSRGLPDGHSGPVRVVEIDGLDRNTCGGTHVLRLAEIQMVHLLGAEAARGGARIRFLAGDRLRRETRALFERETRLKEQLGSGPAEFAAAIDAREAAKREMERRLRETQAWLAERLAAELLREPGSRLMRCLPGAEPELLRAVASRVTEARADALVVLLGGSGAPEEACFVVQSGTRGPADPGGIARQVSAFLRARGGGRARFHQGRGGTLPAAAETEAFLRSLEEPAEKEPSPSD